ncbi:MAG: ribonuclease R, partial [Clostridia bacterium]|nr:ribonuclease R [Clostridia bacterium]
MSRKNRILEFIKDENYTPMTIKDIMAVLCVPKENKTELEAILNSLENEGKIYRNSKNRYVSSESAGFVKGIFNSKSRGYGFVVTDDDEKFYIYPEDTKGAYNKDTVLVKVVRRFHSSDRCDEAKIIKILSHSDQPIVGKFTDSKNFGFVVPDQKDYGWDVYIPKKNFAGAKDGQKVLVKITKWPDNSSNPEGVIEEVLGFEGEKDVDIKSVLYEHSIDTEFPQKVILSAISFGDKVYEEELDNREDLRGNLIFTIDGDDSKDFDDAVEIEKTTDGYRLGVHIADVSYYVSENSALDIEAFKRGTSVYLPGFVCPMLPKQLSNGICSLNPGVDRLTLSVIMDFDLCGNLISHNIYESVIKSKYRMTYNDVSKILDGDKMLCRKYAEILPSIRNMSELAKKLKSNRMTKGSIDFNFPETKIITDENGKPIDVYMYHPTESHSIIEEFMLAANICVAQEMFWAEIPSVYRIHESPSKEKMSDFSRFLGYMGYTIKGKKDNPHPGAFSDILKKIKGTKKELLISKVMLRSLMKAKYSENCLGHFGLGFSHYCHFTSPIRRYPDLVVHRILKEHLKYGIDEKRERFLSKFVIKAAKASSFAEVRAMEAQRDGEDMKKAEFMKARIGKVYDVTITSVTSFAIFAQTDFGIEGMISYRDLEDDYYEFDE